VNGGPEISSRINAQLRAESMTLLPFRIDEGSGMGVNCGSKVPEIEGTTGKSDTRVSLFGGER
jgi:hypothetical protein